MFDLQVYNLTCWRCLGVYHHPVTLVNIKKTFQRITAKTVPKVFTNSRTGSSQARGEDAGGPNGSQYALHFTASSTGEDFDAVRLALGHEGGGKGQDKS